MVWVFGALTAAAIFLCVNQPLGISFLAVIIPLQMYRARQEEKALEAKFGEEYRQENPVPQKSAVTKWLSSLPKSQIAVYAGQTSLWLATLEVCLELYEKSC